MSFTSALYHDKVAEVSLAPKTEQRGTERVLIWKTSFPYFGIFLHLWKVFWVLRNYVLVPYNLCDFAKILVCNFFSNSYTTVSMKTLLPGSLAQWFCLSKTSRRLDKSEDLNCYIFPFHVLNIKRKVVAKGPQYIPIQRSTPTMITPGELRLLSISL